MKNNLNLFILSKYLLDIAPAYINCIKINNFELAIYTKLKKLKILIFLLKNHNNLNFLQLIDICGVDYIQKKKRFEVIYNLLSLKYGLRLKLKIQTTELKPVASLMGIYSSAN
jgi:NADH:ubiquinone oxidoreductase subunit C